MPHEEASLPATSRPGRAPTRKQSNLLERDDLMEVLRKGGLRITIQRLVVLDALQGMAPLQQELCAPGLWEELGKRNNRLPLAACYRTLATFESAGIVSRRLDESSGRAVSVYALRQERRGPSVAATRFRCVSCSRLITFHDKAVLARLDALAEAYDLALAPASAIEISAVCHPCSALQALASHASVACLGMATPATFPDTHGLERLRTSGNRP